MESSDDKLGGEGSIEERFDRLTDDEGKPIKDKAIREPQEKPSQKESGRRKRYNRRVARQKQIDEARKNRNEYWYKDPNLEIKVPDGKYDELVAALRENRETLERLKRYYCRSSRRQHPIITQSYLQEIKRHVLAIEGIKDKMAARGMDYRVYYTDRESPNEACERIIFDCFVASCLYGPEAPKTDLLRLYRDVRLSQSVLGRLAIKAYYAFAGPLIARILEKSPFLRRIARTLLDRWILRIQRFL